MNEQPDKHLDVQVDDRKSFMTFTPLTEAGRAWCLEHISVEGEFQPFVPRQWICEHNYADPIIGAMLRDGLRLNVAPLDGDAN
jgi:hypothetical protein